MTSKADDDKPAGSSDPASRHRVLRWLGVQAPGPGTKRFKLTKRFYLWLVLILFVSVGGGSFVYTSRPSFCKTCHNIAPYYESWRRSAHNEVNCLTCHTDPGMWNYLMRKMRAVSEISVYLTKTHPPKPRAHINDVSCLRSGCHTHEELNETTDFELERPDDVKMTIHFKHKPHLEAIGDKKLRCVSCHTQQTHEEHFGVAKESCFLCHLLPANGRREPGVRSLEPQTPDSRLQTNPLAGGGRAAATQKTASADPVHDCTNCHDAPVGEIRMVTGTYDHKAYAERGIPCLKCHEDSIRGRGEAPRGMCLHCHSDAAYVEKLDDVKLLHEAHVAGHQAKCFECHMPIEHGLVVAEKDDAPSCAACHGNSHGPQQQLYAGLGGLGVPSMPSPMHRARVACAACHSLDGHGRLSTGPEALATISAQCVGCHGPKYEGKLADWQKQLAPMVAELESLADRLAHVVRIATEPPDRLKPVEDDLARVQQNLKLVREGKAVHNINYSLALLKTSTRTARTRLQALTKPTEGRPAVRAPAEGGRP